MTTWRSRGTAVCGAIALSAAVAGCQWEGLNSLPLPGTEGRGDDAYTVEIRMPNVTTLSQNSPVRVNDVTVGSVAGIDVEDWHALVTVRINGDVRLPANATAKIGQTSLLGSQHLELSAPDDTEPEGTLADGDVIPLERAGAYPTTEQTLSSLSVVLNGGGIAQIQTITQELNAALGGREDSIRNLLPQLDDLVGSLDRQRGDIVSAMEGIDRLAGTVNAQTATVQRALDEIPAALEVLVRERTDLTTAMVALGELSDTATRIIDSSGEDLKANLRSLTPVLRELANSGNALTEVLSIMLTYPFPMRTMDEAIRGDYANLMMTVDLTNSRMDSNFFTGTALGGTLGGVEGALGSLAGVAGQSSDPMRDPLQPPAAAPSGTPQIPGLPYIPGLPEIPGLPFGGGEPAP
ncbi:MCE family protein [Rhodococcus triatomae]|uniref:Phospholipid/cholesterol/gamma-HCH transport system substrate-binding protein n=1 Tax=Rhodococcus triatomae TaxID=300028 RepID=A0A1G8B8X0_9NOCA|nr:MCE family protein [Rhodococcus triatomae]QNG17533.1 MCE family protein [Rhodococcus triatomae]QNG22799.1 MCE family protein [Rhodococcus triatomae]SDH29647.1 phospholipid/cholesterol/gamma-HCH transport system substrate-binding protein [Rhodococcus triatomae]